ncbi:origin recognition complex subunit 3 isoform X2 [Venturia canescens]|nr:origin recognition complex subunit 3 isoform X2 [Venturia canescens]
MFEQIVCDLKNYVTTIKESSLESYSNEISTAILLTGVNLPDHAVLFEKLASEFSKVTQCIAIIHSRDSGNMKNLIEETVFQLINSQNNDEKSDIRKNQCTLRLLEAWHSENCQYHDPLVIIVPDFESFSPSVLRDFILVLSIYTKSMKFVLVFGVATTLHAVHRCLSYDVTSKLRVQVFHTQTQVKSLSDVLEGTVLSGKTPFKLTGRAFQLLTDIFLIYDFSVHGFLQGYKLCMLQHFYDNNYASLCCEPKKTRERIGLLGDDDFEDIKKLPSIARYLETLNKGKKNQSEGNNQENFKKTLVKVLENFHLSINNFFTILKCLHSLTSGLPGAPLGKQLREVYCKAVTSDIVESQEYKESIQLLGFLSKDEFVAKLEIVLNMIKESSSSNLKDVEENLKKDLITLRNASLEIVATSKEIMSTNEKLSRTQLKEKLYKMSQQQSRSPYKQAQINFLEYLDRDVFGVHLKNPSRIVGHEIFCFSDANSAKHPIRGSHRAAVHTALTNPQAYLECGCCELENDQTIQATLPDLSIIYKLHLESRKLINMYDWLQAFLTIVNPSSEGDEQRDIDPKLQGRFTRSIAELQFLGFIKTSRRKTDHVKRLT